MYEDVILTLCYYCNLENIIQKMCDRVDKAIADQSSDEHVQPPQEFEVAAGGGHRGGVLLEQIRPDTLRIISEVPRTATATLPDEIRAELTRTYVSR